MSLTICKVQLIEDSQIHWKILSTGWGGLLGSSYFETQPRMYALGRKQV